MKKFLIPVFLSVVFASTTFAQSNEDIWTLERCVDYALENNISIKRQELTSQLYKVDYQQSKYNLLPDLGAGASHEFSSGRSLNIENYEWENAEKQQGSMGIQSRLTLFNGLENLNRIRQSKYLFLEALENLEKAKNDISLNIATYYLQILLDEELLQLAQSKYEVTLLQAEKTERLVDVGNLARGDYLEILAQVATDKLEVTISKNRLELSILDLTQILDLDSVGSFVVYRPLALTVESLGEPTHYTEIYQEAMKVMPEIAGAEFAVLSQEKALAAEKGRRSPELYVDALYYSRYLNGLYNPLDTIPPFSSYTYLDQVKDNQYKQLTIGISIPIFNKFSIQTSISKSKIQLEDSRYLLEQKHQILYKQIQQAYSDAQAALEKYRTAQEAVVSNVEAFSYTQQKFDVGLVNSVDFNIAKNNLSVAQSQSAQAKFEYIFKMKILDFYQGKEIKL